MCLKLVYHDTRLCQKEKPGENRVTNQNKGGLHQAVKNWFKQSVQKFKHIMIYFPKKSVKGERPRDTGIRQSGSSGTRSSGKSTTHLAAIFSVPRGENGTVSGARLGRHGTPSRMNDTSRAHLRKNGLANHYLDILRPTANLTLLYPATRSDFWIR